MLSSHAVGAGAALGPKGHDLKVSFTHLLPSAPFFSLQSRQKRKGVSLGSQGPVPWDKPRCVSAGTQEGLADPKEEGETHLHPLVADGSEVPGPALEHRGGGLLGAPGGRGSPLPVCPAPHSVQVCQPERAGWLTMA